MSFSDFSDAVDRDTAAALVAEGRKRKETLAGIREQIINFRKD